MCNTTYIGVGKELSDMGDRVYDHRFLTVKKIRDITDSDQQVLGQSSVLYIELWSV